MRLFHFFHQWIESGRYFAAPINDRRISVNERTGFGVTTVAYECSICGGMKTIEILGDARINTEKTA